jgi:hypothetical protein
MSAKQAAATSPTYPDPITQIDTCFDIRPHYSLPHFASAVKRCTIPFAGLLESRRFRDGSNTSSGPSTFYIAAYPALVTLWLQSHHRNHRYAHQAILAAVSKPV